MMKMHSPPYVRMLAPAVVLLLSQIVHAEDMFPPGGASYAHTTGNVTILPGGRALKPIGSQIDLGPGAFGLAISPKGLIAVSQTGFERFGISILTPRNKGAWQNNFFWAAPVEDDPQKKAAKPSDRWESASYGIAFESEKEVWIAEGDSGKVRMLDVANGARRKPISINAGDYHNSYTADLAVDPVRHILYVLDQANYRLVLIDTVKDTILSSIATGPMPSTIALSPDRNTVYVANIGLYRYQVLPRPLIAPPSELPGLSGGAANDTESSSVCVIDVHDLQKPVVRTWIRTGPSVGSKVLNAPDQPTGIAIGGSAPTGILAVEDKVYVSNAHADSITVISAADNKVVARIRVDVPWLTQLRGFLPSGMAWDPAKKWLLVAEAGVNAVGVIDTTRNVVIGHLPVGLYPTRVGLADGRVWVVNARGHGSGANASRPLQYEEDPGGRPTFYHGTLSTFTMPPQEDLQKLTATNFTANGFFVEKSITPSPPAAIKHVVLILKEERAFDEILGDIGDASNGPVMAHEALARYGMHGRADGGGTRFSVKDAAITPNHHAIAKQFSFSDNFYSDGDTDVDGHHWLNGVIPDLFTMSGVFASFGGQRHFSTDAPGRLLFAGTATAVLPEEIPENGTLWDHLERNHITFRNYGEALDLPGSGDGHYLSDMPIEASLSRNTARDYPGFSLDIPDQTRADKFIAEIDQRYKSGKEPLPQFLFVTLPNDAIGEERPDAGYPYASSWVADNDLAMGRIVEYLSHSPWWNEMAIFVTEDIATGGIDLVDAHRTILLAAGPNLRRDYVSHTNTSFPGLLKTIFGIFHIPALNLMDQTAASLGDMFTDTPDYTPYQAVASDKRIFDPDELKKAR